MWAASMGFHLESHARGSIVWLWIQEEIRWFPRGSLQFLRPTKAPWQHRQMPSDRWIYPLEQLSSNPMIRWRSLQISLARVSDFWLANIFIFINSERTGDAALLRRHSLDPRNLPTAVQLAMQIFRWSVMESTKISVTIDLPSDSSVSISTIRSCNLGDGSTHQLLSDWFLIY